MIEIINEFTRKENNKEKFERFLDFVEKEYFQILNRLDNLSEKTILETEKLLNVDFEKLRLYIDKKIPILLERMKKIIDEKDILVIDYGSIRDVLGNSVLNVLNRIVWVAENIDSDNEKVQKKIFNAESATRRVIDDYIKRETNENVATYYIDELCDDENKLILELCSENGYLQRFEKFFFIKKQRRHFPTGGKKLPYFKFFSELEKGSVSKEKMESELAKLDDEIINKDKIKKFFNK